MRILVISTGGTIASQDMGEGLAPTISAAGLLDYVGEIEGVKSLDAIQIVNVDSLNINPGHWIKMVNAVRDNYSFYDGFIISHGTDTMGYSAAAMSYLAQNLDKPVVFTGAQKPIDAPITDARQNLTDAIRFTASGIPGVYVVFGSKVIVGTRARKISTKSFDAYESVNFPIMARMGREPFIRHFQPEFVGKPVFYSKLEDSVCLIKLIPGMKPDILGFAAKNYKAVVVESFGAGGLPQNEYVDFLGELAEDSLIVIGTQAYGEGTDMNVTEIGRKSLACGLMQIYDMSIETAAVKLMWLLGQYDSREEILKNFYKTVHFDILHKER